MNFFHFFKIIECSNLLHNFLPLYGKFNTKMNCLQTLVIKALSLSKLSKGIQYGRHENISCFIQGNRALL